MFTILCYSTCLQSLIHLPRLLRGSYFISTILTPVLLNPYRDVSQQTRGAQPVLVYRWANVEDGGPTLKQHWLNASCLLGLRIQSNFDLNEMTLKMMKYYIGHFLRSSLRQYIGCH